MPDFAWKFLRTAGQQLIRRRIDLTVYGRDYLPKRGPMIVAARHFHHLYDGSILIATISVPTHIVVATDWAEHPATKFLLTRACRAAEWPQVIRTGGPTQPAPIDAGLAFRRASAESLALLRRGHGLIVFPEGYPNIDPGSTPKKDETSFLPFQPGFVRLARQATAAGIVVPIVPAGFRYRRGERWSVELRFGEPRLLSSYASESAALAAIEAEVKMLSTIPEEPSPPPRPPECP
jgi:putative membrane protein